MEGSRWGNCCRRIAERGSLVSRRDHTSTGNTDLPSVTDSAFACTTFAQFASMSEYLGEVCGPSRPPGAKLVVLVGSLVVGAHTAAIAAPDGSRAVAQRAEDSPVTEPLSVRSATIKHASGSGWIATVPYASATAYRMGAGTSAIHRFTRGRSQPVMDVPNEKSVVGFFGLFINELIMLVLIVTVMSIGFAIDRAEEKRRLRSIAQEKNRRRSRGGSR